MASLNTNAYDQNYPSHQVAIGVPAGSLVYNDNGQSPFHHHHHQPTLRAAWSSGLCDCCSDVSNCCLTCWCPCITFGRIAEIVDQGSTSCGTSGALYGLINWLTGCACIYSCAYRSKMRRQYNLRESPCGDCLVHFCCESCALCQEYRELQIRGFDMSIGWEENMARQNRRRVVATAPMMEGGMNR